MNNKHFENILDKFESDYEYSKISKNLRNTTWTSIQELVKSLFDSDTYYQEPKQIFINKHYLSAFDENFIDIKSYRIDLHALYPHLIGRILSTENILFTHHIDELFMYCYNKRFVAKDNKLKYRFFTNLAYGIFSSNRFDVYVDSSIVTKTLSEYIKEIIDTVRPSVVGLDVDCLYITDYNDYIELQKVYDFSTISTLKTGIEHQIQLSDFMNRKMTMMLSLKNRNVKEILANIK